MSLREDRNREILQVYNEIASSLGDRIKDVSLTKLFKLVGSHKASRFYISESKANRYIKAMDNGHLPEGDRCKSQEVVAFYNAYLRELNASKGITYKYRVIERAINSPAPSFFLTHRQIMEIIMRGK